VVHLVNDDTNTSPSVVATTDDAGAYQLPKLLPGRYRVSASKLGFATLEFHQRRPFERGDVIFLDAGEHRDHVDIALFRHGAIEGRIVDESGDPLDGASVRPLPIRFKDGRRQLVAVPGVLPRRTNELGRYRVYGPPPGAYFIAAELGKVGTDDQPGYATTYFPGAPAPALARPLGVGFAEEATGVDFALAPVATARITGTAVTSIGEPFRGPDAASAPLGVRWPSTKSAREHGPTDRSSSRTCRQVKYVLYAFRNVEAA
jgi:hypothetical protein